MFDKITIVSIDGRHGNCLGAQHAIRKSGQELPGAKQLLICAEEPNILLSGISHRVIQPLSYFEYSIFVLYCLHRYIETEYALVVQEDGWVLDGSNWSDIYFEYDYIGAPIHFARVTHQERSQFYRQFEWTKFIGQPGYNIEFVQNGGFSLRSHRFLKAFAHSNLPYTLPAPRVFLDDRGIGRFDWEPSESQHEDVYCCINRRADLVNLGLRFAPLDICKYFAFEHLAPEIHDRLNLDAVFGHHSKLRHITDSDLYDVQYALSQDQAGSIYGEPRVIQLLKDQGAIVHLA